MPRDDASTNPCRALASVLLACTVAWTGVAAAAADGGGETAPAARSTTATKYVFPDGRIVYSDRPVPGATAVKTFAIGASTPPSATTPAAGSAAAPSSDASRAAAGRRFSASYRYGACRLSAEAEAPGGTLFRVAIAGLESGESYTLRVGSVGAEGNAQARTADADGGGELRLTVKPTGPGRGETVVFVDSARCMMAIIIPWGS